MKQNWVYTRELAKIEGDFPCPNCRVTIFPECEDKSGYYTLGNKVRNEFLEKSVMVCSRHGSNIRLVGFLCAGGW